MADAKAAAKEGAKKKNASGKKGKQMGEWFSGYKGPVWWGRPLDRFHSTSNDDLKKL